MKHANNFDFLRFLFSFLVVLGHTIILSRQPEFQNSFLAAMPNYSVYCFFIISGFLVYSSIERLGNLKKYFINRIKRIFPAYFAVVIFFSFFLFFFSAASAHQYFSPQWLKYLGANLIFLNFIEPCINFIFSNNYLCAINGALWTIKVELIFYAFIPLLFYFTKGMSVCRKNLVLIFLYILSTVYFSVVSGMEKYVLAKQFPGCLNYFVTGIMLYVNIGFFKKKINWFLPIAIFAVFLEKVILLQNLATPFALGIIIFWLAFLKLPLKNFGKYGDFSYGMYLVHFPIIQIFVQENMYKNYSYAGFLFSISIILAASFLIWNFIEKPILKKKFIHKSL